MNQTVSMFGVALLILTLVIAVVLGLLVGPTSPITWVLILALVAIPFVYRKMTARRFLTWRDEYSVGIESIDREHKKLLGLINQLQTAVDYATDETFEREALDAAVDYTRTHFAHEEALMEQYGYPDFAAHKAEHRKMIDKVNSLVADYESDPDKTLQEALDFLKQWLVRHINGTDKQYSSFLREKGAT
ncbi:bacteriohemerythrin [Thiohalobacter sp. IOR34]|uniref:bacteriohemerythrin n=1 Tax=Thiohalobacter sp. IOR34 TaxID=3057176 RepID=UPI0025B20256|nr:bacteriohemerythrin [Thiohalobacter sp. IOR34]WJW75440.1 bacteriohemerythrin [Thiohalobacter sp. IOR34]